MKKVFGIAAMLLALASCNKVETEIQPIDKAEGITITATLAPKTAVTKAVADNGDNKITVTWAENEHIAILYEVESVKYAADAEITAVDGEGAATISFTVEPGTPDNTSCTLVYPLSAAKDDHSGVKDYAALLAAQDGTLSANLDVRVGEGTIQTATPGLTVTTQPEAQFAIFKFTTKNADGSATLDLKPLKVIIDGQCFTIRPAVATSEFYAALPPATGQTVGFSSILGTRLLACSKASVSFSAGYYYQSVIKLNDVAEVSGSFTINSTGDQVHFSLGNLRAATSDLGEHWTWSFAEHPSDHLGKGGANEKINGNGSVSANGVVDLFAWSTPATYFGIYNSNSNAAYSGDFLDWGANAITNGGNIAGLWRTLSHDEWVYVLYNRTTTSVRYAKASLDGTSGIIILPDDWNTSYHTLSGNNGFSDYSSNYVSAVDWTSDFEPHGAVFLPAGGRHHINWDGTVIVDASGSEVNFWSSTISEENTNIPYSISSDKSAFNWNYDGFYRQYGISVRLVTE